MTDALTKLSDPEFSAPPRRAPRRNGAQRKTGESYQTTAPELAPELLAREAGSHAFSDLRSGSERPSVTTGELERLHRALSEVTTENHPRTARLLASSTRKTAQKVIEEAGEVALEAVKHHTRGIVRESADLLYHLVALWHRAGIEPQDVWIEMRERADTLGIAEKLPKARSSHPLSQERKHAGQKHARKE